jgi:hypothetical protein
MISVGTRTLVAASCSKCLRLLVGASFGRHVRPGDKYPYLDYRCVPCKWGVKVSSNAK